MTIRVYSLAAEQSYSARRSPPPPLPPGSGGDETAVLRCRLVTGRLDAAPRVERISLHAAEAIQIEPSIQASWIGTGEPGQTFSCEEGVFVPESLVIESGTAAAPQTWARIQDLDEAGPFEQAFVIDDHPCAIRLGDGRRGAVLPDSVTAAVEFNRTLGAEGSVKAETSWSIPAAKELNAAGDRILNCANPMPSEAGQDAETVDEALARIAQSLWAHERLVELAATEEAGSLDDLDPDSVLATEAPLRACTVLDYERLALSVPGTTVRRARAWVDYHADYPCLQAPGVVSLIILPELPTARPEPSSGLLWRVRNHLEERRTVGTQLRVFGPRYVTVGVAVRILRLDTTPEELVRTRVDDALRDFLHPLVGGPLGQGWPFGRDVYRSEVLALLDAVEGVDAVLALSMSTDRDDASCGNVCIAKEELVLSGDHAIEVES
ncbi:MAG: hypothetical protein GY946_27050 [bacterium]|nr:hypothetical protein [bacterium]